MSLKTNLRKFVLAASKLISESPVSQERRHLEVRLEEFSRKVEALSEENKAAETPVLGTPVKEIPVVDATVVEGASSEDNKLNESIEPQASNEEPVNKQTQGEGVLSKE